MLLAVYSAPAALHSGRLHVVLGGSVLPHPAKADKGGEDAFLFDDKRCLFGVADGVGGSAKNGVDPGAFSREMLERCHQAAACGVADALPDALRLASECPLSGGGGSSTLVLGQLEEGTSTLRLLNLGDSGAMVLRPAMREVSGTDAKQLWPRVVLRTQEQTHGWNWPYQTRARTFDAVGKEVDEVSTAVREGDIVLAASDGVFDNLFEDALQFLVAERLDALRDPDPLAAQAAADALAQNIAAQAKAIGGMRDLKTPFSEAAQEEGRSHKGGKVDDVAVVCGVVRSGARPPLRLGHNFGGAPCVSEERPVVTHSGAFVPSGERTRDAAPAVGERTRDAAPAVPRGSVVPTAPPPRQGPPPRPQQPSPAARGPPLSAPPRAQPQPPRPPSRPASSSPAGDGGSSSPPAEPRLDGWAEWQAEVQRRNTRDAFSRAQRTLPPALSEAEAAAAWLSEDGRQNRRDALARARPPLPVRADPRVFDDSLEHGMPLAWLDLPRNRGPERNADARYARRAAHVNAPPGHAAPPFAPASLPPPLASGGRPLPPPPRGMPPPPQGLVGSATASGLPPTPQGLPPPVRSLQGA